MLSTVLISNVGHLATDVFARTFLPGCFGHRHFGQLKVYRTFWPNTISDILGPNSSLVGKRRVIHNIH